MLYYQGTELWKKVYGNPKILRSGVGKKRDIRFGGRGEVDRPF